MIRKQNKNDVDKIAQIWCKTNIQTHSYIPQKYWEQQFVSVKEMLSQAEVYVYEKAGEILGFVGLENNYIAGIFVSLPAQSKGIGRQLLNYVKGIRTELRLKVYRKNERAIKFYQREDFVIRSEGVDDHTGEAEYLMVWERQ